MRVKALVFASLAVALAAGLCAVTALAFFYVRARWEPFPRSDLRMEGDWPIQADDEIGFAPVPNGRTLRRHLGSGLSYHLFTDARGARVNSPAERTPPRVDILTIGCSFSWGHGIENEETFTEELRRRMGVTVANFAMGSYGTVHSLLLLRRHLGLHPRVIVYGFIDDHLRRNLSPCAPSYAPFCAPVAHVRFAKAGTPIIHPPRQELFSAAANRQFYEEIAMTDRFSFRDVLWRARIDLFRFRESRAISFPNDPGSRTTSMEWLMGLLGDAAREAGATLLVAHIPGLGRGEATAPPAALMSAAGRHGVRVVDLTPAVLHYYADERHPPLILANDGHPNAAAHSLIADELERTLRSQRLLE